MQTTYQAAKPAAPYGVVAQVESYSLRAEGFRYCASPDRTHFRWIHPAERVAFFADWIDCTDMDDDEFLSFVVGE